MKEFEGEFMHEEVRKGLTQQKVNEEFSWFVIFETFAITVLLSYIGIKHFQFNVIATIVISFVLALILTLSRIYHFIGFIFSIGYGYLGYKLAHFLVIATGGENWVAVVTGIVVFILILFVTIGFRLGGKEYFDDIK